MLRPRPIRVTVAMQFLPPCRPRHFPIEWTFCNKICAVTFLQSLKEKGLVTWPD